MPHGRFARSGGETLVAGMLERQRHRGPEGNEMWTSGTLVLGHRRLPILDLSAAGRQPMHSRDGRWTIVFNGEIFNYRELAGELGGPWRTATDTEVLLEACAAWGVEAALGRAHGMFGLALWDAGRRELTLARDRAGEKPLVYFWDGETLAFASELKALESFHDRRMDPQAADAYFALGYVPAPLAALRGCRKLPAGHMLRFRAEASGLPRPELAAEGFPVAWRWWTAPEECAPGPDRREAGHASLAAELRSRLGRAVGERLRADVPVALALSGGLDSAVVAAECVRQGARPEAFTVRFEGDETDLPYARETAQRLGLPHAVLDAPAGGLAARVERLLDYYDEPFADSSALACFVLAEALAGRYRVLLTGDGGDEAFGGYRHYEFIAVKQTLKAAAAAAGWCDGAGGAGAVYVQSKSLFRAAERRRLLAPLAGAAPERDGPAARFPDWSRAVTLPATGGPALRRALRTDRELALANGLTYKMDIALAAFGIEGRAPLLDHGVLEWGPTLEARQLVDGRRKKVLLRAAYAGELPGAVLGRGKHGFGAPVERWLKELRSMADELVPSPLLDRRMQRGARGQRLWTLLLFAAWARRWKAQW